MDRAEKGVPLSSHEVAAELNLRMDLAAPDALRVLDRSAAAGHITVGPGGPAAAQVVQVALTGAGAAYFANRYAHARTTTDRVVDDIDAALVEAAVTGLIAVQERAARP